MGRRQAAREALPWIIFRAKGRQVAPSEILIKSDASQSRVVTISQQGNVPTAGLSIVSNPVSAAAGGGDAQPNVKGGSSGTTAVTQHDLSLSDVPEIHLVDPSAANGSNLSLAELYTLVAERGLTKQAKSIVMDLMPDVQDVEILSPQGQPTVYLSYKSGGSMPLATVGDWVRLLLRQSLELAAPSGGVVLLEEPEVHMHPGAIRQSVRAMLAAMARGIQVIVTTHSLELIDSLLAEAKTQDLDKLSFYRLQLHDGKLKSYRLSGTEASRARTQIEDDLR
jgi:hypothetical protein